MERLKPMLAESIRPVDLPKYATDNSWFFEQKLDGHRRLIYLGDETVALNRKGEVCNLPQSIRDELPATPYPVALDAELLGEQLWIFDVPAAGSAIEPATPYARRRMGLDGMAHLLATEHVHILPAATDTESKVTLAKRVIEAGSEGLMVKHVKGTYASGKRVKTILKAKFIKDVDCVITRFSVDGKQNVAVGVYDGSGEEPVEVGTVILLPEMADKVEVGSVVSVQYLYCVNEDEPRLVQPTRLRIRDDKDPAECTTDQLRFTNREVLI